MSRIKKRGLDYFPLNTDFMHDRLVRRIMKREGDGSFAILLGALSCIYADEAITCVPTSFSTKTFPPASMKRRLPT